MQNEKPLLSIDAEDAGIEGPSEDRNRVLLDGPVDATSIETMNTVVDDNKEPCPKGGETMPMMMELMELWRQMELILL